MQISFVTVFIYRFLSSYFVALPRATAGDGASLPASGPNLLRRLGSSTIAGGYSNIVLQLQKRAQELIRLDNVVFAVAFVGVNNPPSPAIFVTALQ
jgi:hypothetical protein